MAEKANAAKNLIEKQIKTDENFLQIIADNKTAQKAVSTQNRSSLTI